MRPAAKSFCTIYSAVSIPKGAIMRHSPPRTSKKHVCFNSKRCDYEWTDRTDDVWLDGVSIPKGAIMSPAHFFYNLH